jgi:hypothetical protein
MDYSPGAMLIEAEEKARAVAPVLSFDPRKEVSADARYIVRNLVIWFLLVPLAIVVVGGLIYAANSAR